MQPVRTEDCNVIYKGPSQDVGDLWCHRIRPHMIRTTWEPDEEELETLRQGGRIQITLYKEPIPPLAVEVATEEETEPVGEHGWKIDVEPGDLQKEEEDDEESDDDEAAEEQSEASRPSQGPQNGEAPSSLPDGA